MFSNSKAAYRQISGFRNLLMGMGLACLLFILFLSATRLSLEPQEYGHASTSHSLYESIVPSQFCQELQIISALIECDKIENYFRSCSIIKVAIDKILKISYLTIDQRTSSFPSLQVYSRGEELSKRVHFCHFLKLIFTSAKHYPPPSLV